jgi:hypothetical protein
LSCGSGTVTVLLFDELFPAASLAYTRNEYVLPGLRGGWGYLHVTLVCVPGTVISRPQLSRTRYEKVPELSVAGSQANETLYDVFPVERRFNGFVGAFLSEEDPNAGEPGGAIDGGSGSVASRHAPARTRIDPARAHESDCRSTDMRTPP